MESRIAIEELTRRWPRFEVDEANTARVTMSNVAGYASVPGAPGRLRVTRGASSESAAADAPLGVGRPR